MTDDPGTTAYHQLARELSTNADLIAALLVEHDNLGGHCRSCTVPGTGQRRTPSPCPIRRLALLADTYQAGHPA